MSDNISKSLKGNAGVSYTSAYLNLFDYVSLPTIRNQKAFDLVAYKNDLSKIFFIQVKSTDNPKAGWPILALPKDANIKTWKKFIEEKIEPNEKVIWVFVALPKKINQLPDFYIVPSAEVSNLLIKNFDDYLKNHPKAHIPKQLLVWGYGDIKKYDGDKYLNNWNPFGN